MESVSLIVPAASAMEARRADIAAYRRVLEEQPWVSSVQVILAGPAEALAPAAEGATTLELSMEGEGSVALLREAISAAAHDLLVVVDPRRGYTPAALGEFLAGLDVAAGELAIGVPARNSGRSLWRTLGRRFLGTAGSLAVGTSDVFSGLLAFRRSQLEGLKTQPAAYGSRLVLDLLTTSTAAPRDISVRVAADDRLPLSPLHINDLRQLKRVLDRRFGTFSRLVQFCMVGASGMVVDLTLYAIFQLFLPLARAGILSILTALVWNFALNRRLTFNDARGGSILRQFLTYVLGNALGIAVSLSLRLYLPRQLDFFDRHRLAAAVVGIIAATAISFSMSRWVVFIRRAQVETRAEELHFPVESSLHNSAVAPCR